MGIRLYFAGLVTGVNIFEKLFSIPLVGIKRNSKLSLVILVKHAILFVGAIVNLNAKLRISLQNSRLVFGYSGKFTSGADVDK